MADTPEQIDTTVTAPVDTAAAVETVVETPESQSFEPSLLSQTQTPGTEEAKTEDKPAEGDAPKADAKPEGEAKAATEGEQRPEEKPEVKAEEAAKPETPAELPKIEYEYKLPETLKMDDAVKADFHSALDAMRRDPVKGPQELLNLHEKIVEQQAAALRQQQWDVFNETRKEWRNQVLADSELGGAGHRTAMAACARMRDMFASSAKPGTAEYDADLSAFNAMLDATGVGDHPVFLRMMHRVAQAQDEPQLSITEVGPVVPNRAPGRSPLYDNPRSKTGGGAN